MHAPLFACTGLLPSDVLTIRKRGTQLRSDYQIASFKGLKGWDKGHFSQLLLPSGDLTSLDHVSKAADRGLRRRLCEPTDAQMAMQMTNLVLRRPKQSRMVTDGCILTPTGKAPHALGPWSVTEHELSGVRFEMRMRDRVDSAGDLDSKEAVAAALAAQDAQRRALAATGTGDGVGSSASGDGNDETATGKQMKVREQVIRARARFAPLVQFARRLLDLQTSADDDKSNVRARTWSFEEYFGAGSAAASADAADAAMDAAAAKDVDVAVAGADAAASTTATASATHPERRVHAEASELVSKEFGKGKVSMCATGFPFSREQLLPIFEVLENEGEQFESVRRFLASDASGGSGASAFPVRFTIPVLPAVSATVTFMRCELTTPDASLFIVPDDYEPDAFKYMPERIAEDVAKKEAEKAEKAEKKRMRSTSSKA